jgi:hypothetical protein
MRSAVRFSQLLVAAACALPGTTAAKSAPAAIRILRIIVIVSPVGSCT